MRKASRNLKKVEGLKLQITLGEAVRRLRKCAKVSQQDLSALISIHQTALSRVESGQQNLLPWQLQKLSEFFNVKVDSLLSGSVNYWMVAERFNQIPPFPEHYRQFPFSKTREVLPFLHFIDAVKGPSYSEKVLSEFGMDGALFGAPDSPVGIYCGLDLFRNMVTNRILTEQNFSKLIDQTRTERVQGFLHPVYETQESALRLVKSWVLNAHHYDTNFNYEMECGSKDTLHLSVTPADHMAKVSYKDDQIGDMLCRYKREYISQFPKYIGQRPAEIEHKECHYHGASRCLYTVRFA
jgi:transcriptional regulator with XRE-family HTH domain